MRRREFNPKLFARVARTVLPGQSAGSFYTSHMASDDIIHFHVIIIVIAVVVIVLFISIVISIVVITSNPIFAPTP